MTGATAEPAAPAAAPPQPGGDYDRLPYPSMPFADTQPSRLAALATLFGLNPPGIAGARVLELGCASGGNIIPLAARFPQSRFTGIDLSRRHVEDGRQRAAALGLTNVALEQANLAALDLSGQQFDYILCNGVFSWVPQPVQEAIFRLCRDTLAPDGVATISYNVLPGWHMRMVIRDLCLHYAGTEGPPQHRAARARAALAQVAAASDAREPYGMLLRTEAQRLKGVPSAYIMGEFLAPDNAPCTVQEFIGRAARHGLDYLCEADLCAAVPPTLDPAIRASLTSFAGPDRAATEQQLDFVTGRLFRRSVLVRARAATGPTHAPNPEQLALLHMDAPVRLDPTQSTAQASVFTDDRAQPTTINDPTISRAIGRLAAAFPGTMTLAQLTSDPACGADDAARIRQALFTMVLAGRAGISAVPAPPQEPIQPFPRAWPVARLEAASGQPWLTSLRHVGVPAHPVLKELVPLLDGKHDRTMLQAHLAAALREGKLPPPKSPGDGQPPSPDHLDALAAQSLGWALAYLARHGFLEPPGA